MAPTVYVVSEAYSYEQSIVCAVFKTEEEAETYVEWRQNNGRREQLFVIDPAPLVTMKGE